jgi:hypothetical protein
LAAPDGEQHVGGRRQVLGRFRARERLLAQRKSAVPALEPKLDQASPPERVRELRRELVDLAIEIGGLLELLLGAGSIGLVELLDGILVLALELGADPALEGIVP